MQNWHSYNKIFQKIWGASGERLVWYVKNDFHLFPSFLLSFSGGWSVVLCPHGVFYSLKLNLRADSPRNFMDLLLSWQHLPNVTIYDFVRGLATHANFRVPSSLLFQPYEGRLADSTPENINKAKHHEYSWMLYLFDQKKKFLKIVKYYCNLKSVFYFNTLY